MTKRAAPVQRPKLAGLGSLTGPASPEFYHMHDDRRKARAGRRISPYLRSLSYTPA